MEFITWRVRRNLNILDSNPQKKYIMYVRFFVSAEERKEFKTQALKDFKKYLEKSKSEGKDNG